MKSRVALALLLAATVAAANAASYKIGVFIPGVREGSPTYENLAKGAERFAKERPGSSVKVFEAGFNQAEWEDKLRGFVATGGFDFIITSNPSMPDLIERIAPSFPSQKFIALDGRKEGVRNLYTVLYNQVEQGYLAGYLAGLVSLSGLKGANPQKKAGMIIGQRYPVMDKLIVPGFEMGLKAADPAFSLDLRVLGNWYDATKAAELARNMFASGVDVVLPICGSASQGAIKAAQESGAYLVFFDSDEYSRAPGTIVGCVALEQESLAYGSLERAAAGKLPFGSAETVGVKEGFVRLLDENPAYTGTVPESIRDKMDLVVDSMKSGKLSLAVPSF